MSIAAMKKDNRGVSLLLVVITMSFIAVIAAVIIALTYRNLQVVETGINSSSNFYSAETAMDELKMTFEEWSDVALRESYSLWLQKLNTINRSNQEVDFKQMYTASMKKVLDDKFMIFFGASPSGNIEDLFVNFSSDVKWNEGVNPSIVFSDDKTSLTLKNVSLVYKDSRGFSTTISTDYVFNIEYPGFSVNTTQGTNIGCSDYVIISDTQISAPYSGAINSITGNIYGGGYDETTNDYKIPGIKFDGNTTNILCDKIVSKNDIELTNGAMFTAKGTDATLDYTGELHYCDVWVNGMNLTGNGDASLNIQGNCYVADDMTLDAKTSNISKVNISGTYFGYRPYNYTAGMVDKYGVQLNYGTPEGSSSIVVNSGNSVVDLTKCSTVWIAGKTFVSVPSIYGISIGDDNVAFPEGESLSYRGLQAAYLLPGDCIEGIGHNPMTEEEYEKLAQDLADNSRNKFFINLSRSASNGGVRLNDYVKINSPFRVAMVTYSNASSAKLVYLYLNFINSDYAAKYFNEYCQKFGDLVKSRMASLGDGNILFNPETITSTGNLMRYNSSTGDVDITPGNENYNSSNIDNKETELTDKYNGLVSALDENYSGMVNTQFLTDSIVDMNKVRSGDGSEIDLGSLPGVYDNYKLIVSGRTNINIMNDMNGIIITSGNVNIEQGRIFKGLIIARGKVTINGTYKADADAVSYLIKNNPQVAPYFKFDETDVTNGSSNFRSSDIVDISYANWKKN